MKWKKHFKNSFETVLKLFCFSLILWGQFNVLPYQKPWIRAFSEVVSFGSVGVGNRTKSHPNKRCQKNGFRSGEKVSAIDIDGWRKTCTRFTYLEQLQTKGKYWVFIFAGDLASWNLRSKVMFFSCFNFCCFSCALAPNGLYTGGTCEIKVKQNSFISVFY